MSDAVAVRAPFPRFWLSAFLADFGDGVRLAAFPLLAVSLTHSPLAVSAATAAQGLPVLLVGPATGVVADRCDLRRLMVSVDAVRAAFVIVLAGAVATGAAGLGLVYATAVVTGLGAALRDTAAGTALPRLVESDGLEQANGRLAAGRVVGFELAGPAAGGWLFGVGAALPFALDAGTTGLAILLLLTLPGVFGPLPRQPASERRLRAAGADLRDGLRWLGRHRTMRGLVVAIGVIAAADAAWFAVLVLYVTRVLGQPASSYGLLLAVAAVGGVVAGVAAGWLGRRLGSTRLLVAGVLVLAATQVGLALTRDVRVAAGLLAASSGAFAIVNVLAATLRQRLTPPELLGRVTGVLGTVGSGAEALGALAGGAVAAAATVTTPMLASAPALVGAAALLLHTRPGGQWSR